MTAKRAFERLFCFMSNRYKITETQEEIKYEVRGTDMNTEYTVHKLHKTIDLGDCFLDRDMLKFIYLQCKEELFKDD